jgi:hypothetical protein
MMCGWTVMAATDVQRFAATFLNTLNYVPVKKDASSVVICACIVM